MTQPVVELAWSEVMMASFGGLMRWVKARSDGRSHELGRKDIGIERDICGALAEFAVSRHFGISWSPAVGFLDTHLGDLDGIQVKSVTAPGLSLIFKPDDDPDFPFILVRLEMLAKPLRAVLVGWKYGFECRKECYLRTEGEPGIHKTAYFVPESELKDLADLAFRKLSI